MDSVIGLVMNILTYLLFLVVIISWLRLLWHRPNRAVIVFASYAIALFMLLAGFMWVSTFGLKVFMAVASILFLRVVGRWALDEPLPEALRPSFRERTERPHPASGKGP